MVASEINYDPEADPELPVIVAGEEADVRVALKDTGNVENCKVIIARYQDEPLPTIAFSSSLDQGGARGKLIKFAFLPVNGFTGRYAEITVYYSDDKVGKLDERSLFLAYWSGESWQRLDNIRLYLSQLCYRRDTGVVIDRHDNRAGERR